MVLLYCISATFFLMTPLTLLGSKSIKDVVLSVTMPLLWPLVMLISLIQLSFKLIKN